MLYYSVSQSFLASTPFSDKQMSIAPLPSQGDISTKFFRILYIFGMFEND